MPQPTSTDLAVVDPLLTNISVAYVQDDTEFIADKVFPTVETDVQGGKYPIYDKGDWLRAEARVRAPGTESAGGGWKTTSAGFFVDIIAVHKDLDDPTKAVARSRAGGTFNLESDATRYVTQQALLKRDIQWVTGYFTSGVWANEQTGVAAAPGANQFVRWDVAGSVPITDIKRQALNFRRRTGYPANTLVLGPDVWFVLSEHSTIISRIQYVERGIVTSELLAALFGVPRVFVAYAVQNLATEGAADNIDFIAGRHALLAYAAPSPSLLQPSAGYTFAWTGYPGTGGGGIRIKNFRMEHLASDRIESEYAAAPYIVSSDLGVFYNTAVSSQA